MKIEDIVIGGWYWVDWLYKLPTKEQIVGIASWNDDLVMYKPSLNSLAPIHVKRISQEKIYVSPEFFDHWWNKGGGCSEECFYWLAQNLDKVCLDGVKDSNTLAERVRIARRLDATGEG